MEIDISMEDIFAEKTVDENDDMFTTPSGTGKSTHIALWKKYLGDEVEIINGDKPIISWKLVFFFEKEILTVAIKAV